MASIEQERTVDQMYKIRSLDRPGQQDHEQDEDVDEGERERFDLAFHKEGPLGVILVESYHPR